MSGKRARAVRQEQYAIAQWLLRLYPEGPMRQVVRTARAFRRAKAQIQRDAAKWPAPRFPVPEEGGR